MATAASSKFFFGNNSSSSGARRRQTTTTGGAPAAAGGKQDSQASSSPASVVPPTVVYPHPPSVLDIEPDLADQKESHVAKLMHRFTTDLRRMQRAQTVYVLSIAGYIVVDIVTIIMLMLWLTTSVDFAYIIGIIYIVLSALFWIGVCLSIVYFYTSLKSGNLRKYTRTDNTAYRQFLANPALQSSSIMYLQEGRMYDARDGRNHRVYFSFLVFLMLSLVVTTVLFVRVIKIHSVYHHNGWEKTASAATPEDAIQLIEDQLPRIFGLFSEGQVAAVYEATVARILEAAVVANATLESAAADLSPSEITALEAIVFQADVLSPVYVSNIFWGDSSSSNLTAATAVVIRTTTEKVISTLAKWAWYIYAIPVITALLGMLFAQVYIFLTSMQLPKHVAAPVPIEHFYHLMAMDKKNA